MMGFNKGDYVMSVYLTEITKLQSQKIRQVNLVP